MSFDLKIFNGDLVLGSNGDIKKVEGIDKLVQDILKMATSEQGSNPFAPWYGCKITKSIIGTTLDPQLTDVVASNQLRSALETLQRLQREQAKWQRVTPEETLAALRGVGVRRNQVDPRYFEVAIQAVSGSFKSISTGFEIKSL